ncbi:ABC transporter permease, partial [Thermogemmatispora sp.]|uniref:ABC transporter permease n=1 Tax=Thermogemmatispora sp. TaxID=1968838 RepID=UPI0035E40314
MRNPSSPSSIASHEPAAQRRLRLQRKQLQTLLFQLRALVALIILVIIFSLLSPDFLTLNDLTIVAEHVSINALLAIGQSFVILTAGIDLSVGSIVGLTAMVAGYLISQGLPLPMFGVVVYFNVAVVLLIGLLVGGGLGLINGLVITRLGVAPFIATLGMLYAARGLALLTSNGATFPDLGGDPALGNTGFPFLGTGNLLGVPMPIWLMLLCGGVAAFVASRTPFGRQVYAIGGNERAAQLSGIRVKRVKLLVYVISGVCAALTGLVIASQLQAAQPATGESYELNAIAAVVLGGTSLFGGRGTILGSIIGAFVIGVL